MSATSLDTSDAMPPAAVRRTFAEFRAQLPAEPRGDFVTFTDQLIAWCGEYGLIIEGFDDLRLRFTGAKGEPGVWWNLPARRSVLRAIMARLSALCDDRDAPTHSPYGGAGSFTAGTPPRKFHVEYANTQAEQRFTLRLADL